MSKKKNKFDLTYLVHRGYLKEGQLLYYVSNPTLSCRIVKQPNGEFKVLANSELITIHAFAQKCLQQDPPDHASRWLRTEDGKTLYELWHIDEEEEAAAA